MNAPEWAYLPAAYIRIRRPYRDMESLTYVQAWARWFHGESVSNYFLWHIQILWWGRAGKLISFISALAVIAEIIGSARLRDFGKSLHGRFTLQKALIKVRNSFGALRLLGRFFLSSGSEGDKLIDEFLFRTPVGWVTMILGWGGTIITFVGVYRTRGFWSAVGYSALILIFGYALIAPLIAALLLLLPVVILLLIDLFIIEPVAWLLERESVDKLTKAGSLFLLLLGFHFDLLAS